VNPETPSLAQAGSALRVVSADVGIDDACALIFLHRFCVASADYIVATGGNVRASLVAANCAFLKEEFGFPSRLFAGTDPPESALTGDAAHVHGPWGLGRHKSPGVTLPPLSALVTELQQSHAALDMLVLGPATDAVRLIEDADLAARLVQLQDCT